MSRIYIFAAFLFLPLFSQAQYFQAYAEYQGNDIVFFLQPNSSGGDITTGWSDIEFFLRYPTGSAAFSYGAIAVHSTNFPGISVPYNGDNQQGSETGFVNSWFGTSYSPTAAQTYTAGQPYEVFRVTLNIDPSTVAFELVHNAFFSPTYLALVNQAGADMSSSGGANKFYGSSQSCACPGPSTNDILAISAALPVELIGFAAQPLNNKDALLNWETASEEKASHFEIERSKNGRDWEWVGEQAAQGISFTQHNYVFTDEDVFTLNASTSSFYYRLKMVDVDGSYEYSPIRNVTFKSEDQTANIKVYPNPVGDYLQIELSAQEAYTVELYDLHGRRVLSESNKKGLNVSRLQAGTYALRILVAGRPYGTAKNIVILR